MAGGLGIDLIEIGRLERVLARRPGLARRLFTDAEISYAGSRARPGRHLAARFAAKEAVVKALGISEAMVLREIEVVAGEPPQVRLSGRVAEAAARQGLQVSVSLTHTEGTAAAVALAEKA
ncbi:MAG: holo-ACP synthase [Solirubrobacterales bacterium]